jgi:hypothetical protein
LTASKGVSLVEVLPRDRENLLILFDEQLEFLRASADAYSRGFEAEAKRLAVTIRTLVHDTARSHGLLTQLNVKDDLRWKDTAQPIDPTNLLPTNGLAVAHVTGGGQSGTGYEARYVPALDTFSARLRRPPVPFDRWWKDSVTKDEHGNLFSRRDFVLTVANKEGGAHVDPELNAAYRDLTEGNSLGVRVSEGPPDSAQFLESGKAAEGNAALASLRQVTWEILETLERQASFLLYPAGDDRRPVSRLCAASPCPCGSGRGLAECHIADPEEALALGNALLERAPLDAAYAFERRLRGMRRPRSISGLRSQRSVTLEEPSEHSPKP